MSAIDRVLAALAGAPAADAPPVENMARRLGLSTRSLHRQLAAAGTTYQRLVDDRRRDEAIRRMLDERGSLRAIAEAVGFADPRGFRRAFKRWTGATPQQFRRSRYCDVDRSPASEHVPAGAICAAAQTGASE